MKKEKVLVAGATGYLGQFIVKELKSRGYWVRALIRKEEQKALFNHVDDFFLGEITNPTSLKGITNEIDWVFSSIGITRQKDGLTYMDVDYQGNLNLLKEAKKEGVKMFQYVSAINGNHLTHLKIFEAKEKFVDALKNSGLTFSIIRPSGFFSDMKDFLEMAKNGKVYLFGNGNHQLNPISGKDLSKVCIDNMINKVQEETIGGADVFTQNEIAEIALSAYNKPINIVHLPDWIRKTTIFLLRTFTSSKTYGPFEFFLTVMALDNVGTVYGKDHLKDFYFEEAK